MRILISKRQWESIGKQGKLTKTSGVSKHTYADKNGTGRTITLIGSDVIDLNVIYTGVIKSEYGSVESQFAGTLAEIYIQAKEHNFAMPETKEELQTAQIQ